MQRFQVDGLTEQCQALRLLWPDDDCDGYSEQPQAGFRNVMLSKKSVEVLKLLEAVKAQFAHMDEEVEKTQKQLSAAVSSTDKLAHRTKIIKSRMRNIGEMDISRRRAFSRRRLLKQTKEYMRTEKVCPGGSRRRRIREADDRALTG